MVGGIFVVVVNIFAVVDILVVVAREVIGDMVAVELDGKSSADTVAVAGTVKTLLFKFDLVLRRFCNFGTSRKNGSNMRSDSL